MPDPYADIHYYDGDDNTVVDDDGDPRQGWYFQFMEAISKPLTGMYGPYSSAQMCEAAALREWAAI